MPLMISIGVSLFNTMCIMLNKRAVNPHRTLRLILVAMTEVSRPLRAPCPPGACICAREALLQAPQGDARILQLTHDEEKRLLQRLQAVTSLAELRHLQARMVAQLGLQLSIRISHKGVRSLRGIVIALQPQPGLCRKTRQAIPAAIKKSMQQHPEIAYALLDEGGLFAPDA